MTATEVLNVQAISGGSYFQYEETPGGTIDGSNTVFTLAYTPNPASSLILALNGSVQKAGASGDYTLSGNQITFNVAPAQNSTLVAKEYTRAN